ncbi:M20 family metallopeptidase [uncultured Martelella sp.]|uniref:M20 family metallopeptidase n=1 Tax=uncultured Martelella sp. TaxID=392331 RepID=UPI0029C8B560|nr:M20 family metallopeptidase [uncultured Martelella sp.]
MNVTELTRHLVAIDTVNPPGNEKEAMALCAGLLSEAGFDCREAGKGNLLATRGITDGAAALAFTGHLDTVPLGDAPWRYPAHDAAIADGRIFGRGTTDMKGGVAAFVCAAINTPPPPGGIALMLTVREETGSEGARLMAEAGGLPEIGGLIVTEPTSNRPVYGHKGAFWLRLRARGVTAHGSMPEKGDNAISRMVRALGALEGYVPGSAHAVMGKPTLNVGTIRGGLNTNSVPDLCEVTVDMRSVPGVDHAVIYADLAERCGSDIEIDRLIDLPSVWTDPQNPWITAIAEYAQRLAGADVSVSAASYFTDASILTPALGNVPTIILGPGDPELAHQTDESVSIERLNQACAIYGAAIEGWDGHKR